MATQEPKYIQYLNLDDNENFQQVYTSQLYGTFFTVQAKFNTIAKEPEAGDYFVESIEFEVLNYKGYIDIGIMKIEGPKTYKDIIADSNVKLIHLKMRGMVPMQTNDIPEYKPPKHVVNEWFDRRDTLHFARTLAMLHDDEVPLSHGAFDSEFYYREGIRADNDYSPVLPSPRQSPLSVGTSDLLVSGTLCTDSVTEII